MKGLYLCILPAVAAASIPSLANRLVDAILSSDAADISRCPQPAYQPPHDDYAYFNSSEFVKLSLDRLSTAITFPTVSYDDLLDPEGEVEDSRWETFVPWHEYLQKTYPRVHQTLERELVGGYALLYTFQGSTDAKPLVLAGHQDVVPASTALDEWVHPPFEGHYDGEWIWGRGASDCKSNVIGLLSVFERLLERGFRPKRTIILAFGEDEEASGTYGATRIGAVLEDRYGTKGIEMIIDEGGLGLDDSYGPLIALPALTEKGYADVRLELHTQGGHSSVPPKHTSVGLLSRFVVAFEDGEMYHPTLTTSSPYYRYCQCLVEHGNEDLVPQWLPEKLKADDLDGLAHEIASESNQLRYLLQTSNAATVFQGGVKANALPEQAQVTFNSRISITSSVEEHFANLVALFVPVAKQLNLTFEAQSKHLHTGSMGKAVLGVAFSSEPAPVSAYEGTTWDAFASAVRTAFGPETVVSPTLSTSNTDTRHYWSLSDTIVRWTPARTGTRLNAHTVNERIKLRTHLEAVSFYYELIMKFDSMV